MQVIGGRVYDNSVGDGRCAPIRTDPENDVSRIYTDGEMPQGENDEMNTKASHEMVVNRIDTVVYHSEDISGFD